MPSVMLPPDSLRRSRSERARPCSATPKASAASSRALPSSGEPLPPGACLSAVSASAAVASSYTSLVVAKKVVRASSASKPPCLISSMVFRASR